MVKFIDLENRFDNEPRAILVILDKVPEKTLKTLFPLYSSFIKNPSVNLFPFIQSGINNDVIIHTEEYHGFKYRLLRNNGFWNTIALIYKESGQYDRGREIIEEMMSNGASDAATLNNFATIILNKMISKGNIEPDDEVDFEIAKKVLYKAFIFDAKGKPRSILDASSAPAYKNLINIRNIEAEFNFNREFFFTAFIYGWISVEMNLNRIWCKFLRSGAGNKTFKEKLSKYYVDRIIDVIYSQKVISKELYTELHKYRKLRNDLIHGAIQDPTPGDTINIIQLSRKLTPILKDVIHVTACSM